MQTQSQRSALALWSVLLGILALLLPLCLIRFSSVPRVVCGCMLFIAIPGVICGHFALGRIYRADGLLKGNNLAVAGLVIGYLGIGLSPLSVLKIWGYIKEKPKTQALECLNNMRHIDFAIRRWAQENGKADTDAPDAGAVAGFIKGGVMPTCPAGGDYILAPTVGASPKVTCPNADRQPPHMLEVAQSQETNFDGVETPSPVSETIRDGQGLLEAENPEGIKVRLLSARRLESKHCVASFDVGYGGASSIIFQKLEPGNSTLLLFIFTVRLVDTNIVRLAGIRALAGETELKARFLGALTDLSYIKSAPRSVKEGKLVPYGWGPKMDLSGGIGDIKLRSLHPGGRQDRGQPQLLLGTMLDRGHLQGSIIYGWPPDNDEAVIAAVFEGTLPQGSPVTFIAGGATLRTRIPYRESSTPLPSL